MAAFNPANQTSVGPNVLSTPAYSTLATYTQVTMKEDVSDIITNISPDVTFLINKFGRAVARATLHPLVQ